MLGLKAIIGTNAKDFPSKASTDDYDYILNSPMGIPEAGDLMIWNGTWGHIAIYVEGDVNSFVSFDENYPTNSPCVLVRHSYQGVIGWLHPKKESMGNELDTCMADRKKFWEERDTCRNDFAKYKESMDSQWKDLQDEMAELRKDCEKQLKAKDDFYKSKIKVLETHLTEEKGRVRVAEDELEGVRLALRDLTEENLELKARIEQLKEFYGTGSIVVEPIFTRFINWLKRIFKQFINWIKKHI